MVREGVGVGGWGSGERRLYLILHCHHQNDSCIKMGVDETYFNVSFMVRSKVTKNLSTNFEEKGEHLPPYR